MKAEALKVVTPDGTCYAIFPRGEIHCLIVGDEIAVNYFMSKSPFMTREHGYPIDLDFIDFHEFELFCNRRDLGVTISDELTDDDEINIAIYTA